MKEIKLKPETSRPKVLESAARAPKDVYKRQHMSVSKQNLET